MKLSFHGADRTVTGSCHMVECAGRRILIDCGLYQGGGEIEEENARPFGFDPAAVDIVLLTHAHLDHCGRLPLLVKRGFRGEIVATAATAELARLVMVDAAGLQEEDSRFRAKRFGNRPDRAVAPLYSVIDALNTAGRFGQAAEYGKPIELAPGLTATFLDAGHILGSVCVFLEARQDGRTSSVLFSGDLGKTVDTLLTGPARPPHADAVVVETTYGDRDHRPLEPSVAEFYDAVTAAFRRGGNVVVPTFALERAQEILYLIGRGIETGRLPPSAQVYVDSPMAISATEVMERNPQGLQPAIAAAIRGGRDPFHFAGVHFTRDRGDSQKLNDIRSGAVILAGSGMCTGGRVRHHLMRNLPRAESSIVFVGFAAVGTLARAIVDGAAEVGIFGERVPVRARIHTINGFSAHADRHDLLAWLAQIAAPRTFLVHGEQGTMGSFASLLHGSKVEMPELHRSYEL